MDTAIIAAILGGAALAISLVALLLALRAHSRIDGLMAEEPAEPVIGDRESWRKQTMS